MSATPQAGDLAPGFTVEPNHCWRMIYNEGIQGTHCPEKVRWRGRFENEGKRWTVEACNGHRAGLTAVQRVAASGL